MTHLNAGDTIEPHQFEALSGESVPVPDPEHLIHLELRRFAGCPVCNLHLRSVVVRNDELKAAGIREVVVFHSSADDLHKYQAELPFDVIPDPDRKLYTEFGVEHKPKAILSPAAWPAIFKGLAPEHRSDDQGQGARPADQAGRRLGRSARRFPDRLGRPRDREQVRRARLRPVVGGRGAVAGQGCRLRVYRGAGGTGGAR